MTVAGRATSEGTWRYGQRLASNCARGHFRRAGEWTVGSIGIGTHLGDPDDRTDRLVQEAIERSVRGGINLLDCAINYRHERGERSIGAAVARLVEDGDATRDELVVCTKGGFLPVPDDPSSWFETNYVRDAGTGISNSDLVAGCHCMHPDYLRDQIDRSLANLGLATIDVYYLHNPETQLGPLDRDAFHDRLLSAFEALEAAVREDKIGCYGLATWSALRVPPDHTEHLDLSRVKRLARRAAGGADDALRFVQLPFNLAMPEALLATQQAGDDLVPALEAARQNDLQVVTSASICQARLVGNIPQPLTEALGDSLTNDAQRALQFTRSCPGISCALVGMKEPLHVHENLRLVTVEPLSPETFLKAIGQPS